jgi:AraC-like DNA-binding protein
MELLPRVIHVKARSSPRTDWLHSTLELMAAEAKELRPGGETIIARLADLVVIQAIRAWIHHEPGAQAGWLGAFRDKQIGRAIALIHRDPPRQWSVASLPSEVAMSRSAFAARFTELVGQPAMHYLARWRMHVASTCLKEDSASVSEIANRLGYGSDSGFAVFRGCGWA